MKKLDTMVCVTFQRVGYHNYPDAPEAVDYLKSTHRHLFKFKVCLEVFSADREVEFHLLLRWLEENIEKTLNLDYQSCEMLADCLADLMSSKYAGRKLSIEVWEDGECGSISTYEL